MRLVLLAILAAILCADYTILLKEQLDTNNLVEPVTRTNYYDLEWNAKGNFIFSELQRIAHISQKSLISVLNKHNARFSSFSVVNAIIVHEPSEELLKELATHVEIDSMYISQKGYLIKDILEDADAKAETAGPEWNVKWIKAPEAWAKGHKGQGIVVAHMDTGVVLHDDLIRKYRGYHENGTLEHDYNWLDASRSGACKEPCDSYAHGTHTMGTICGSNRDNSFIVGVAPEAKWISCKNSMSLSGEKEFIECFQWFLAPFKRDRKNPDPSKRPHVVSHSWRFFSRNLLFKKAVENLHAAGILQVFAAGNEGSRCSSLGSPSGEVAPLTVGALGEKTNQLIYFSSRGPPQKEIGIHVKPDITAPGTNVLSCKNAKTGYQKMSGTSMATPAVTGSIALLLSARRDLIGKVDHIKEFVAKNAVPLKSKDCSSKQELPNNLYGWGMIDCSKF